MKILRYLSILTVCISMLNAVKVFAATGDIKMSVVSDIPSSATVQPGTIVTMTISLENVSTTTQSGLVVTNNKDSTWNLVTSVGSGETAKVTYRYTVTEADVGGTSIAIKFSASNNSVTAVARSAGSDTVSFVVAANKGINFTASNNQTNVFPVKIGGTVKYDLKLLNTGNSTINNIQITSNLDSKINVQIPALQPGISRTETVSYIIPVTTNIGDLSHTFTLKAEGFDNQSQTVTTPVTGTKSVSITTKLSNDEPEPGEEVQVTIYIRNTGQIPLKNLVITTPLDTNWSATIALLAVDATATERFKYKVSENARDGRDVEFEFDVADNDGKIERSDKNTSLPTAYVTAPRDGTVVNTSTAGTLSSALSTVAPVSPDQSTNGVAVNNNRTLDGAPQLGPSSDNPVAPSPENTSPSSPSLNNPLTDVGISNTSNTTSVPAGSNSTGKGTLPKTGDSQGYLYLGLLSIVVMCTFLKIVNYRKFNRN